MKISKQLVKDAGIQPKLRLGNKKPGGGVVSTGIHRVKMIADKMVKGKDIKTGKVIDYVRYLLEEDGETKTYQTRHLNEKTGELSYLVQRLAEIEEGEEVFLEMKKQGAQNYVEVTKVSGQNVQSAEVEENEDEHQDVVIEDEDIQIPS